MVEHEREPDESVLELLEQHEAAAMVRVNEARAAALAVCACRIARPRRSSAYEFVMLVGGPASALQV